MSGRRRSETVWDKQEKRASAETHSNVSPGRSQNWSKSEVYDDLMHGNSSRSPSWDPSQGNRNGPEDDDHRRDRNRMYSHPNFDGWKKKQYSTYPSDDSYDMQYRSRDKGEGGHVRGSRERERERTRSPNGRRSRSRDGLSKSSRGSTRGHRHETYASYPNMRNYSKHFASRGGGNNIAESWSRSTDYKDVSGYNDYPRRNVSDDYRTTRIPCRYFAAGNCYRDDCKFSHYVPEAAGAYNGNRNLGNKTRTWQQPHDDLNAKSNLDETQKKTWNGSLWDDVKSGGFDDNNNKTWDSWDDKKRLLDGHASQDASCFHDVGKSHPNLDNKKSSWNDPTSWDGVSGSGFSSHKYEESAKESLNDKNAKGRMSAKSSSNIDRNEITKWDGPLWDEINEPLMVQTNNSKSRNWEGPGLNKIASDSVEVVVNDSDLNIIAAENTNQQILTSGQDLIQCVHDINTRPLLYLNGSEQSHMLLSNPFNALNGEVQGMCVHMEKENKEGGGKPLKPLEMDVPKPQAMNGVNETSLSSQLTTQAIALPTEMSHKVSLDLTNAIDFLKSLPKSAYNQDTRAKEDKQSDRNMEVKLGEIGVTKMVDKRVAEDGKKEVENKNPEAQGKAEDSDIGNDDKAMRQFKVSLVDFVKEILKPKWKEGKMSRDVHKTVVKKVVEKVTSTIQGTQIPRTQPKIDQYLAYSKPKITKLVEAYMERLLKA